MSDKEPVPDLKTYNLPKAAPVNGKAARPDQDAAITHIINSAFDIILDSHGRIAAKHPSLPAANPNLVEAVCRRKPELVAQFTEVALDRNYSRMELLRYMRTQLRRLLQEELPK